MGKTLIISLRVIVCVIAVSFSIRSQVNLLNNNEVYDFLERFDARGIININHHQKPIPRQAIFNLLQEIALSKNLLSLQQQQELNFYLSEYNNSNIGEDTGNTTFLEDNSNKAFRFYEYNDNVNRLVLNPDFGLSFTYRNSTEHSYTYYNGLSTYGSIGKIFSIDFDFNDVSIKRTGYSIQTLFSDERGFDYPRYNRSNKTLNYDRTTGAVTAGWDWGYLSLRKDYNYWGTGNTGKLILSDKAPSYPHLFLNVKPFEWLEFSYLYGELISSINDSLTIRNSGGTRAHIQLVEKYIAAHLITFDILNDFKLTVGESVIISDRFEPIYLIPVLFFRMADHYNSHSDLNSANAQVFGSLSYRIPSVSTRLDFSLFIDELKITDRTAPRAIGYSIGISNYDLIKNNFSVHAEYVRTEPFVYTHGDPAQSYANRRYFMGHWIGSNSDLVNLTLKYIPFYRTKAAASVSYVRKGSFDDINLPRYQSDQKFLYGDKSYYLFYNFIVTHELLNNFFIECGIRSANSWGKNNLVDINDFKYTEFEIGSKVGFR